ncbi:hypothetical protein QEG98_00745 [Myxococcus sp. MxC21-1]|nr:hypothetical protein [Myxococcus sp. MxC21-1]WNZ66171.1 hypothetical protein QEG98_00745 [Myxococcus sp. MxC21-1]
MRVVQPLAQLGARGGATLVRQLAHGEPPDLRVLLRGQHLEEEVQRLRLLQRGGLAHRGFAAGTAGLE